MGKRYIASTLISHQNALGQGKEWKVQRTIHKDSSPMVAKSQVIVRDKYRPAFS